MLFSGQSRQKFTCIDQGWLIDEREASKEVTEFDSRNIMEWVDERGHRLTILGHKNVETTQVYADMSDETKRQNVDRITLKSKGQPLSVVKSTRTE